MSRSLIWKSILLPALLLAALWLALAALFAAQFVVAGPLEWDEAFSRSRSFWLPWLPLLPAVYLLTRVVIARRLPWWVSALIFAAACAGVIALCHTLTPERPGTRPQRPEEIARAPQQGEAPPYGPPWARGSRPPRDGDDRPPRPDERRGRGGFFGPLGFRSILDAVLFGGVVSVTYAFAFLRRSQQRERHALELEASLSRARLDALRLQINPHFLFNTLNAIAGLIHSRPAEADEMTASLSDLLRASLDGAGTHEVPLHRELEILRLFTGIERIRFGERIAFREDIAPECLAAFVPSLLLQPLVENAIRHGLEPGTGHGTVTITAQRDGSHLLLTVEDDGTGINESTASTGIGLSNTRARLHALYGSQQRLTIATAPARGTVIRISLPWHTA